MFCNSKNTPIKFTFNLILKFTTQLRLSVFLFHCSPCGLHLAPKQQRILGRASFSVVLRLYFDHLDLKKNTAKRQFRVLGEASV